MKKVGSVKDLVVLKKTEKEKSGIGEFVFSDRYSVFDWGEMPNLVKNKGRALCTMGAFFFEKLEDMGIKTHYLGVVGNDVEPKRLSRLKEPSNKMRVKLLRVIKPAAKGNAYDYSIYKRETRNLLIPLEVIYRNSLPEGSSVFKRLKEGTLKLGDIDLIEMPKPGMKLERPVLDVSTKLEATDRYVNWNEASKIAGLSEEETEEIRRITLVVDDLITREAARVGLFNEDGKVEFGFDEERNLILLDVLGTPDECRFTYDGMPVSKEVARIFYRSTPWYGEVEKAKKLDRVNWKELVKAEPPQLPKRFEELVSMLYQACCNEITKRRWFATPPLRDILSEIKESEFI